MNVARRAFDRFGALGVEQLLLVHIAVIGFVAEYQLVQKLTKRSSWNAPIKTLFLFGCSTDRCAAFYRTDLEV